MKRDRRRLWFGLVFLLLLAVGLAPQLKVIALGAGGRISEYLVKKKEWRNPSTDWLIHTLDRDRRIRAEHDLELIGLQLMTYQLITGAHPRTEQGIAALVAKPTVQPVPRNWKQLLYEVPTDPWGRPYRYEKRSGLLELRSLGLDAIDPTDDFVKVVSTP